MAKSGGSSMTGLCKIELPRTLKREIEKEEQEVKEEEEWCEVKTSL